MKCWKRAIRRIYPLCNRSWSVLPLHVFCFVFGNWIISYGDYLVIIGRQKATFWKSELGTLQVSQTYTKYLVANAPAVLEKQIPSLSDPQIFNSRSCTFWRTVLSELCSLLLLSSLVSLAYWYRLASCESTYELKNCTFVFFVIPQFCAT